MEIPQLDATARVGVWLFWRGLALIYFFAFGSLVSQIGGLIGSHGILPAEDFLAILGSELGGRAFFAVPSLFWLHVSDGWLRDAAMVGVGLSVLLFFDVAPALVLGLLWGLYLSLVSIGQDFFAFQWDGLLLEVSLLGVLLAPWRLRPHFTALPFPPRFPLFLMRWLLCRFLLFCGVVKLASGDPSWRWPQWDALSYHFFTQPLPSALSWYFAQAPPWLGKTGVGLVFAVELGAPFLIFGNAWMRRIAFGGIVLLQGLIALSGNLAFLNGLTIVLALPLLDDAVFARLLPNGLEGVLWRPQPMKEMRIVRRGVIYGVGGGLLLWSGVVVWEQVEGRELPLPGIRVVQMYIDPWRSVNGYGLFAVMTKVRQEITIEGSEDGKVWQEYRFRYKPGDPMRRPPFVAPYQPRLDWQMWFAALGSGDKTPWFRNLLVRLLQGEPEVTGLLAFNPFPEHPPHYVRALFFDYRFTTPQERTATGAWWKATRTGWYYPSIALDAVRKGNETPLQQR